jgi:hypothetical protein
VPLQGEERGGRTGLEGAQALAPVAGAGGGQRRGAAEEQGNLSSWAGPIFTMLPLNCLKVFQTELN